MTKIRQKVAVIGCGVMGSAIATRLLDCGHRVTVYDTDTEKSAALATKGAAAGADAAEAVSESDYVILSLNAEQIVRAAVFDARGVAAGARRGTLIIDMSSIDPISTRTLAREAKVAGLHWLDCPLSGGAPKALTGTLAVMAGGPAKDFERARLVMDDLCANFTLMGPHGAGQTTKLINQVLCGLNFAAVAEATQLALNSGVDARKIPQALAGGRADSAILQEFMGKMARRDYSPTGRIDNMVKDLDGAQALARSTGTAMPLTALCAEIHRLLAASGLGAADNAALMRFFDGPKS